MGFINILFWLLLECKQRGRGDKMERADGCERKVGAQSGKVSVSPLLSARSCEFRGMDELKLQQSA